MCVSSEEHIRSRYCRFHPYHLYIGTPLPDSGNSLPFHRELSIIPYRIRDPKKERKGEGESSRGRIALLLFVAGSLYYNLAVMIEV